MKVNMKKISLIAGLLASTAPVYGMVPMNDQQVMEASISNKGLTRLSVKGDIIQDIFVYPFMIGNVVTSESIQLHKSGHVFIAPDGIKEPFYLTVITQKGQVQDLKLSPSVQKSAPLVLTLPVPEDNPQEAAKESKKVLEKHLLAVLQGIPPRGFTAGSPEDVPPLKMGDLKGTPSAVYTLGRERLAVYTLENTGEKNIMLMPEVFLSPSDLAVVFDNPILAPQHKIRVAILTELQPLSLVPSKENSIHMEKLSTFVKGKIS
jgi:hypothetical protein